MCLTILGHHGHYALKGLDWSCHYLQSESRSIFDSSSTLSRDNNYLFLFFNNELYCWNLLFTYFLYFARAVDTGEAGGGGRQPPSPCWSKKNFST